MRRFQIWLSMAATLLSAWPAKAQPLAQNPLEHSIILEGRRLAGTLPATAQPGASAIDPRWAPVRMVPGGSNVEVWTRNAPPVQRVFVSADSTSITVLNVMNPTLPRAARRVLRRLAQVHPDTLLMPDQEYVDDGMRLDRAGLSIGPRLLASREHLVERIGRDDLRELRFNGPGGTYWRRGLIAGMAAGALIGYTTGSRCGPAAAPSECTLGGIVFMPVGAGLGAVAGVAIGASVDRPSARVIYAALDHTNPEL